MKKTFIFGVVLFFALALPLFGGTKEMEDVLKAYEAFVIEAEKLAAKPSLTVNEFASLEKSAGVLEEKAQKIDIETDVNNTQYAERFAALEARYDKALNSIMQKLKP